MRILQGGDLCVVPHVAVLKQLKATAYAAALHRICVVCLTGRVLSGGVVHMRWDAPHIRPRIHVITTRKLAPHMRHLACVYAGRRRLIRATIFIVFRGCVGFGDIIVILISLRTVSPNLVVFKLNQ